MSSRLAIFRARLNALRRARAGYRAVAAWSALGSSLIVGLMGVFLLDFTFGLAVGERIIAMLLAAGAVAWSFWRFTRPLIGRGESEIEMALLVEDQHEIDTDLIAALQFESPHATAWGSPQLQKAVVDYVEAATPSINVFRGFDHRQTMRRAALFVACLVLLVAFTLLAPSHAAAFANRLLLGSMHYPSRTRIEQIFVNQTAVYAGGAAGAAPADCKAAQGRPLTFLVLCSGELPATGRVVITADNATGSRTQLEMRPLTRAERLARLQEAAHRVEGALQNEGAEILPSAKADVQRLVSFDAPQATSALVAARKNTDLRLVASEIDAAIRDWPTDRTATTVLEAELARLNDDVSFKIKTGDASTDPAHVQMIPLPVIETKVTAQLPKYAANRMNSIRTVGGQFSVLEGSSVEMAIESMNRKALDSAWIMVQGPTGAQRIDLVPRDAQRFTWAIGDRQSPFRDIRRELRYEIQVVDMDGLGLETPIRGTIRIRPDEPPTVAADILHKVVVPTAEPVVRYRSSDDFGISKIDLLVAVERAGSHAAATSPADSSGDRTAAAPPAATNSAEVHRFEVYAGKEPLAGERLPAVGSYPLSLSALKLAKGDALKLTLEATDYRGENEQGQPVGQGAWSDSLVLQISDESGVLAAISEGDQRSEQQLTEIIKRQLGTGDQPQ